MNRLHKALGLSLLLIACGAVLSFLFLKDNSGEAHDTVTYTRMASEAALYWPQVSEGDYHTFPYDFSAADHAGRLLYQTSPHTAANQGEALKRQDRIVNVIQNGKTVGTLYIAARTAQTFLLQRQRYALLLFTSFSLLGILFFLYFLYLERSVVRPFRLLQDFARQIARGNLDVPLLREKNNLFGAFTEAFDLMRTQLLEARELGRLASQSKKELVASLSHDIKTPVTSIKLLSELMLVTGREEKERQRLHTIYDKAEQIDRLITDLFHSSLEELGEMKVHAVEIESRRIPALVRSTDYDDRVLDIQIPDCLILADPLRLEQIIGNLIMNSYKYANTPIHLTAAVKGGFLNVTFYDQGCGVSEEELPLLTTKFYRGKNTAGINQSGAGLGLYIASRLMQKMDGSLICRNCPNGFAVELLFLLA